MSWDGRTADEVWLRCYDCTPVRSFRESDYRHHVKNEHLERPEEDAMTLPEVAKALGMSRRWVFTMAKQGKLRCFTVGGNPRRWVRRRDLKTYVRNEMELHPEKALKWAETGVIS